MKIGLIETLMAASPVVMLAFLLASLWSSSDNGKCPAWLSRTVTAVVAGFVVLMTAGAVLTWGGTP